MASEAQRQLVDFLDRKAFEPVLRADPGRYPQGKRRKLEDVQQATRAEIDRFHHYRSAEEVVVNFKRDLSSSKAKQVHRDLDDLGLPTIEGCRDEFLKLAGQLGIQ